MFCAQNKRPRGAFTLLEVVISVAIIGMIAVTLYRFIESNLRAIGYSTQLSSDEAALQGLMASLQAQLNDLPLAEPGVLLGENHQFSEKPSDEMQWLTHAGNGLFTQFAEGEYKVTLALRPVPNTNTLELGLRRVLATAPPGGDLHWLRLLTAVDALEIRYFDLRLNAWLEKWTDQQARPALVRIRIWRAGAESPFEAILALPMMKLPA